MKKIYVLVIGLTLLIAGCTELEQDTEVSTASMTAASTKTPSPTATPLPTLTPTLDPVSTLKGTLYYWSPNNTGWGINSYNIENDVERIILESSNSFCELSVSPDGRYIVYPVYPSGEIGSNELYLLDVLNDEAIKITNQPGYYHNDFSMSNNHLIAFVAHEYGQTDLFLYDIEQKSLEKITDNTKTEHHPNISPDGKLIVYASSYPDATIDLEILEVETRQIIHSISISQTDSSFYDFAFSPDNRWLAFTESVPTEYSYEAIFHVLNLESYEEFSFREELGLANSNINGYGWSPESNAIAIIIIHDDIAETYMLDLESEELSLIYSIAESISALRWSPDGSWIAIETIKFSTLNPPSSKIIVIDPEGEYDPITIAESDKSKCNLVWIP